MTAHRWTDEQRAEALELYAAHGLPEAVRRTGIPRSTIDRWSKAAGVPSGSREQSRRSTEAARTSKAAAEAAAEAVFAERMADRAEAAADLSELLIRRLAPAAAGQLLRYLERAEEAEALFDAAHQRWGDCLRLEALAADEGPDAARNARQATREALADLEAVERRMVPTRDLLAIVDRTIADHLALEGTAQADAAAGDLIVEMVVPEPEPGPVIPQAELPQR